MDNKNNEGYQKSESLKSYFRLSQSLFSARESGTAFVPENNDDNTDDAEIVNALMMINLETFVKALVYCRNKLNVIVEIFPVKYTKLVRVGEKGNNSDSNVINKSVKGNIRIMLLYAKKHGLKIRTFL